MAGSIKRIGVAFLWSMMIAIGAASAVLSFIAYDAPGDADMPTNPFSPAYGSELHDWAVLFAVASGSLFGSSLLCRGAIRWVGVVALIALWCASFEPTRHYCRYFLGR